LKLKNRVCLITGAGRGIGRQIAQEFAKEGAIIFVNDINAGDAAATLEILKKAGAKCYSCIADVGSCSEVGQMFEFIYKNQPRLDVLVNNAAILRDKTLHNMDIKYHWDDVIRINLNGVFYCTKQAIEKMRENKFGRIINMTSVIALCGNFGQTAYGAAKAGVIGFTKSLAHETALKGITVNAIAPGFIETEMIKDIPAQVREKIESCIPMGKFGSTLDIAKLAAFIASDESGYITGQVFNVNGGFLMP
jgi:3-oxoacyl-[acyl-carrier protein] reductase